MRPRERRVRWFDQQVISALLVGGFGGMYFGKAAEAVAAAWAPEASRAALPAPVGFWYLAVFLGLPYLWARPIAKFLETGDPARRDAAWRRFDGLFRFLGGLWAAGCLVELALCLWLNRPAGWRGLVAAAAPVLLSDYYGAYFTMLFLEPLVFPRAARCFHGEADIFKRKTGPLWSVHARLLLLVVNLVLIPLLLLELSRRAGAEHGLGVVVVTFIFAAGSIETLYSSIAKPLKELNRKMARLAAGDYGAKTIVLDDDEIGELKSHFNDMVDGLAERERIKETFGRYVSVEVAKRLIESGKISLGGESIEATILFSDIRDFTPLSERLSPQDLVAFLNSYFSYVTEPIAAHNGMVNKFIGDAVMAVFAPQFGSKHHVDDALKAALGMRERLAAFNASGASPEPVRFGVGIHTGVLVAGNIGTERRLEYTVIGDTVNIASRIESQNKELASTILVSEDVYAKAEPGLRETLRAERCDNVKVKGKDRPLVLYKVG